MKVRVYDKSSNSYFKSEVYAKVNTGWYEKQLVHFPSADGGYIKLFDTFEKDEGGEAQIEVLINTVLPNRPKDWIYKKKALVNKRINGFSKLLHADVLFFEYCGYPWLFEDKIILADLLNGGSIPYKGSVFENKVVSSEIAGWSYIETNRDANELMESVSSFHDSVLVTANYTSGAYVNPDWSMYPLDDIRQVTMLFESQWCKSFEMVFEAVTKFNLRPAKDNFTSDISMATLFVKNETIFFCDGVVNEIDEDNDRTWISAYSLRWRFL